MPWDTSKTTTERGYGWAWQKRRLEILKRDSYLCQPCLRCGKTVPADAVDHIKQKADGGTYEPDNLESTCDPCHKDKTARDQGRRVKAQIGADGWPE